MTAPDHNQTPSEPPLIVIERTRGLRFLDLRELWAYRELAWFLAWRDIKVRYKQTAIGVAWAVLQPLAMMLIFTFFFGRLARLEESVDIPYPLFAYAGLLPWQLFSRTLAQTSSSLVTDQRLITKVYFPRLIVPASSCLAALVDLGVGSVLLVGLMAFYGFAPPLQILFLPLYLLLMFCTVLGVGFWLSSLNAEYRDVMYTMPFLQQVWLFLTPVVYPSQIVPEWLRLVYGLNPMVGVVEGVRWCLFGSGPGPSPMLLVSAVASVLVFFSGIYWFRSRERVFIDLIGG